MKKKGGKQEKTLRILGSIIVHASILGGIAFGADCRHADEGAVIIIASVMGGALVWAFTGTLANISDSLRRMADKETGSSHGDV